MSRLDRLVVLLEAGSTPFIRNTAADQLSDLAKGHPEDIINLLGRVYPYLKSPKWETRIAAARAFGGIVKHADLWEPNLKDTIKKEEVLERIEDLNEDNMKEELCKIKQEQEEEIRKIDENFSNLVSFDNWNLYELLKGDHKLLACGIDEQERTNGDLDKNSFMFKIKKQKLAASEFEGEVKKDEKNDDISTLEQEPGSKESMVQERPAVVKSASNARLKAMQKRRAKVNAKSAVRTKSVDISQSSLSRKLAEDEKGDIGVKMEPDEINITSQSGGGKLVVETKSHSLTPLLSQHAKVAGMVWQFQGVYELLLADLFDDKWEVRHGSALGLRELVKKHGKGAGRILHKSKEENDLNNSATLEDLAVRLCTLFVLDRFGDYVSDTVVAPVRESGAQTLAALLIHLRNDVVLKTFDCLKELILQKDTEDCGLSKCWEAKHGGMLGLRYFVSVRTDILLTHAQVLDSVVLMVLHGLQENDDVQAVAALTLTPIASEFVRSKRELIHTLLSVIWDCMTNLSDDLSASIGSVMDLLAKLCTHKEVIEIMQKEALKDNNSSFELLVPRLFPFLRHSITNVRKSVLRTLMEFLSIEDESTKSWINSKFLRLIFQNLLVEINDDILNLSSKVYEKLLLELNRNKSLEDFNDVFSEHYKPLLTLLMTPIGHARHIYHMNTNLIMRPSGNLLGKVPFEDTYNGDYHSKSPENDSEEAKRALRKRKSPSESEKVTDFPAQDDLKVNIDAPVYEGDVMLIGYDKLIKIRCESARWYGISLSYISDEQLQKKIFEDLLTYLKSPHATPRLLTASVIEGYCNYVRSLNKSPSTMAVELFLPPILEVLSSADHSLLPYFRELVQILKYIRTSCLQLFDTFVTNGKLSLSKVPQLPVVVQGEPEAGPSAFGIEYAQRVATDIYDKALKTLSPTYRLSANRSLEDAKHRVLVAIEEAECAVNTRIISILAGYASALIALDGIPKKLNPIIRSLMDSIKLEETEILQFKSAVSIAHLIEELNKANKKGAVDKIVKNLCAFLCVDTSEVPEFQHNIKYEDNILSLRKEEAKIDPLDIAAHEKAVHEAKIKRKGSFMALEQLLGTYDSNLFTSVPKLKELVLEPLNQLQSSSQTDLKDDIYKSQSIIDALGILRALLPKLSISLYGEITERFPVFLPGITSKFSIFRYSASKCFATICQVMPEKAFPFLVKSILPLTSDALSVKNRQGAVECIYHITSTMGTDILPYVVFLIVPVLGRMSDSDHDIRILATTTFASIIKLVPLEAGIPDPENMPPELLEGRDREREFIQQMMDPSKIKEFELPVSIKATLRKYQQEGVNWLAFLNKYHLHGILCDDMGLGKTLQTICIVASDHHLRQERFQKKNEVAYRKLPSLIICPPSLTGHWEQEFNQYSPFLSVLVYAGPPSIRESLKSKIASVDIVVTSYDVARNDIEFLEDKNFNYLVLDEGHIIKNAASKLTKSVKRLRSEHRLILSGTPIQNNVLELWSLFDFLMPGFLGTEKIFHEKFAKPIAASRNSKTSSREQEAGALALESLHKQVLPFMLRRLKEEVLSDLPPKIIQDYYCELSDLQKQLYKEFTSKQKSVVKEEIIGEADSEKEKKSHVFQALQYMRKLCNHPALVLSQNHPKFTQITDYLKSRHSTLHSIEHAPKLTTLKTLLLECGIGTLDTDSLNSKNKAFRQQQILSEGVISDHRALVFCQLKDMLDIVENDLLKKHLPSVTYMRLDGSTDPRERQSIVRKFNEDPSIDVLLLTTKVGGLGLNLTGADTVIFVEHDWNPMNDLQAMDRAHRLGQKKVVNVYRLITKDTLEEKIMGLQKFKMNIASTIVNQQNSGLGSMDTTQLLDLFEMDLNEVENTKNKEDEKDNKVPADVTGGLSGKAAGVVGELGDLWDESQYEDEYNLDNFIKTLK